MRQPARIDSAYLPRGSSTSILIVSDEDRSRDMCAQALRNLDYELVVMKSAAEAVALLHRRSFDLLLSSLELPDMNGAELVHRARALDPLIAVVMLTSHPTVHMPYAAIRQSLTHYLGQPFVPTELRRAVTQALEYRAQLVEHVHCASLRHMLDVEQSLDLSRSADAIAEDLVRTISQELECTCGSALLLFPNGEERLVHVGAHEQSLSDAGWHLLRRAIAENRIAQTDELCCGSDANGPSLALPLQVCNEVIGALLLTNIAASPPSRSVVSPPLSRSATQMIRLMTLYAALALRNAQLQQSLQAALQHVQEFERLKSEFISIASHELRTPLAVVLGYTTMMLRESMSERQRDYLQRVIDSALRINGVVDDMLNLHQLEIGRMQLSLTRCSLRSLLTESVAAVELLARDKEQQVYVQFLSLHDEEVAVDREKVILAVTNLLSNAVKFTPWGGTITLQGWYGTIPEERPAEIPLEFQLTPGRWVYISVTDTGIGIAPEHQEHIFERFYQIADSLTRAQGGAGLGLSITRGLVMLHGGMIRVWSEKGCGSTFAFVLPQSEVA